MLLGLPTFDAYGVRWDTHEYNGHAHHNMHKSYLYKFPWISWNDHHVAGFWW